MGDNADSPLAGTILTSGGQCSNPGENCTVNSTRTAHMSNMHKTKYNYNNNKLWFQYPIKSQQALAALKQLHKDTADRDGRLIRSFDKILWPVEEEPGGVHARVCRFGCVVVVVHGVRCTQSPVLGLQRLNHCQEEVRAGDVVAILIVHLQMPMRLRVAPELKLWGSLFWAHAGGGHLGQHGVESLDGLLPKAVASTSDKVDLGGVEPADHDTMWHFVVARQNTLEQVQ